ncbi:hypothetical protein QJU96_08135 [Pasteurella skyensis]|uniref:Uncharacterized protein n=1 Tax=Phocoenobacter skyensis TaxID=97481 RepID=A0AAJ6NDB8_9PAST|nr:hypothetical protein [Pasteurella skyensis]MDP8171253.1 hypothetical protein [Pasteurella skyensis]MDP8174701.1 hypothetical protein [Pasteurella skyensis]
MGHNVVALITKQKPIKEKLEFIEMPNFVEKGFYIIPLNACHSIYLEKKWGIYLEEDEEYFGGLGNIIYLKTIEKIAIEIGITDYALIGTDYFGGIGSQAAKVYKNSKQITIKNAKNYDENCLVGVDINSTLRAIGVIKERNKDEFDTINLSHYRCFEKYYEKYEKYCEE